MTFPFPQVGPDFLETWSVCVCVGVCVHTCVYVHACMCVHAGLLEEHNQFLHSSIILLFPVCSCCWWFFHCQASLGKSRLMGAKDVVLGGGSWTLHWAYCVPEAQLMALSSVGSFVGFSSVLDFLWSSVYGVYLFRSLFPIGSPHG